MQMNPQMMNMQYMPNEMYPAMGQMGMDPNYGFPGQNQFYGGQ